MAMLLGTWELGLGYGHIAHLAPLAQALNVRGHRMSVASRNPATAAAAPGQPFAEILLPPTYRLPQRPRTPTLTYAQVIADGGMTDAPAAIALVRAWLAIFDRVKPEAIVAEHAPLSLLAAHVARLPVAMLGPPFMVPPATKPLPSLLPWTEASDADRAAADAPADAVVREACRTFGAPRLDGLAALLATAYPCLTTWPELDHHGPRRGATYYGPLSGFAGQARPAWPKAPGPRLFVYLPFDYPRAGELVQAIAGLGWPTIWHSVRPPAAELPPHMRFSPEPVDLQHILGEAALLVGRAGHGTACRAIAMGRPQLMLPDTLETMLVARQVAANRLGAVATAPGAAGIRAALEQLAGDSSIAAAAAAMRTRYGRYQPELAAAQLADAIIREFAL
jgi:UDP:flavonoid glycosyltransferase YjiC (YdhE family)